MATSCTVAVTVCLCECLAHRNALSAPDRLTTTALLTLLVTTALLTESSVDKVPSASVALPKGYPGHLQPTSAPIYDASARFITIRVGVTLLNSSKLIARFRSSEILINELMIR